MLATVSQAGWVALAVLAVLTVGLVGDGVVQRARLARARRRIAALEAQLPHPQVRRRELVAQQAVRAVVGTATRLREGGVAGLLMSSIDDLTRWATEDRAEIAKVAAPDGTVTIMFSDIEDSTALNEELGDSRWVRLLAAHDAVVRRHVDRHGGHVVKTQGDGFMVVFGSSASGVRAATGIQAELARGGGRALRRTPVRVRIGLHVGQAIERDGDFFGRNVALAARVAGLARGGEVLVSGALAATLADTDDVRLVPLEPVTLKGLSGRHALYAARLADEPDPAGPAER